MDVNYIWASLVVCFLLETFLIFSLIKQSLNLKKYIEAKHKDKWKTHFEGTPYLNAGFNYFAVKDFFEKGNVPDSDLRELLKTLKTTIIYLIAVAIVSPVVLFFAAVKLW